jgi:membrane-associated HD superfamily phosphohydrolase
LGELEAFAPLLNALAGFTAMAFYCNSQKSNSAIVMLITLGVLTAAALVLSTLFPIWRILGNVWEFFTNGVLALPIIGQPLFIFIMALATFVALWIFQTSDLGLNFFWMISGGCVGCVLGGSFVKLRRGSLL